MQLMDKYGMSACECYYDSYAIYKGKKKLEGLPATYANTDDEVTSLEVYCKDPHNGLEITLQYSVFEKLDVITRSVKVKNGGADPIELRRLLSACVELDSKDYDMITLYGTWARERHVQRNPLHFGKQLVDSCPRSHQPRSQQLHRDSRPQGYRGLRRLLRLCAVLLGKLRCGLRGQPVRKDPCVLRNQPVRLQLAP